MVRTKRDYLKIVISHVNIRYVPKSEQRPLAIGQQIGMSAALGDSLDSLWVEAIITVRIN